MSAGDGRTGLGQQLLLRGYGPLVAFMIFFAMMAALVPTVEGGASLSADGGEAGGDGASTSPGAGAPDSGDPQGGGDAEGSEGPQVADPGAAEEAGGGGGERQQDDDGGGGDEGGDGGGQASSAGVQPCEDRELQVPGDPYSPPCMAFDGDNGGATHRGVTEDTILFTTRTPDEPGFQDTLANLSDAVISDTPQDIQRTVAGLTDYFNERFQFYGRELEPIFFEGQGSPTEELLGGGREGAQADALTVAQEYEAFAELNGQTEPYGGGLSEQGVINFGVPYLSAEWMTERRPYAWSMDSDCDIIADAIADYVVKRVIDKPAEHAGGELQGQERRVAYIAPDNPWYQGCVEKAMNMTRDAGHDAQFISYQLDLNTMSNQAANLVARLQNDGITTVQCSCDPVLPVFLTARAHEQGYQPEWVVSGVAWTTTDYVGQVFQQDQWSRAFGISFDSAAQPSQASLGYNAYKQVRDDEPAFAVQDIYNSMYLLATGIQMAGPNLTPDTFEQGMFDYPEREGPEGVWGFSEQDYTPRLDYREVYWDPEEVSPFNNEQGAYVDTDPGTRFRPGDAQPGDPKAATR
jgi:hypothetical protein